MTSVVIIFIMYVFVSRSKMRGAAGAGIRRKDSKTDTELDRVQEARTIVIQSGYSVLTYPLDYARTLIQVATR